VLKKILNVMRGYDKLWKKNHLLYLNGHILSIAI